MEVQVSDNYQFIMLSNYLCILSAAYLNLTKIVLLKLGSVLYGGAFTMLAYTVNEFFIGFVF